jgi:membrane-associated protease RseP (regulator of RpoE activity)
LAAAAEQVLCRVSERADGPLAGFAVAALDFHHRGMSQESRERLEALGAMVTEDFSPLSGQRGLHVVLTTDWRGTPDDLRLVPRLRNVVQVSVRGVRLDDTGAAALARVRGVERFELYGTGITDTAVDLLRSRFPESKIDIRKGGKLGVSSLSFSGPCEIRTVEPGSAADQAGLRSGDVFLSINGSPVVSFAELTTRLSDCAPGEAVKLVIARGGGADGDEQRIECEVRLDSW